MAFTGSPVVVQLNDHEVRITGVSLALSAAGTIGLTGATGGAPDITLPATFKAAVGSYQGSPVGLQDSITVLVLPDGTGALTNLPVSIVKTGTAVTDFRATLTNTNTGLATQPMEILVRFSPTRVAQPSRLS